MLKKIYYLTAIGNEIIIRKIIIKIIIAVAIIIIIAIARTKTIVAIKAIVIVTATIFKISELYYYNYLLASKKWQTS